MTIESRPTSTITWAEGPSEYTTTDPAAKKVVGWDGDGNEIPAGAHHNWLMRELSRWVRYLTGREEAVFNEVHEALTAGHIYPATFKLVTPGSELRTLAGLPTAYTIGGSTYDIAALITDGCNVYALMHDAYTLGKAVIAIHPDAPATALWTWAATNTKLICCDGRYVYLHDLGVDGIRVLDADTGVSLLLYDPVTPDVDRPIAMVANGRHLAVIDTSFPAVIEILSVSVPTPPAAPVLASLSQVDLTGSTDIHMCLHGNVLYVVHTTAAVETHLAAYLIDQSPSVLVFDVNLSVAWAPNPTPAGIACDGERVYLVTDRSEPVAGVYGSVHAFSTVNGLRLWTMDMGGGVDAIKIAVSRGMVWAVGTDAGNFLWRLDAITGAPIYSVSGPDVGSVITADEICCYLRSGSDVTKHFRVWRGGPAVEMQVVNGYDIWRSPNKHRAVPVR